MEKYYIQLNDSSELEIISLTSSNMIVKGETVDSIHIKIADLPSEEIKTHFANKFNTRIIKLLSSKKVYMSSYNGFSDLYSINLLISESTDETTIYEIILTKEPELINMIPNILDSIDSLNTRVNKLYGVFDLTTVNILELKYYRVMQSRYNLQEYLNTHPVLSNCHKGKSAYYTCTGDKQQLLMGAINLANIHAQLGTADYLISWNAHGEECTDDWTLQELIKLAIDIEAVVKPLIKKQQSMEDQIMKSQTKEEIMAVSINF